jgi:Skp family chaperone for outer membrane proteins
MKVQELREVREVGEPGEARRLNASAFILFLALPLLTAVPALAQTVPAPATAAPAAAPMVQKLFRADSKVGFVDLQRIFNESAYGKQGIAKIGALQKSLADGLTARSRDMQALSDKIKAQQTIVAPAVWLEWNGDLQRMQREAQFAEQEANMQVEQLQQRLLANFEILVRPVIESVRAEKNLWAIFAVQPVQDGAGTLSLIAADPAIDLSAEVVALLDRQSK